jgi:hypothetical protein
MHDCTERNRRLRKLSERLRKNKLPIEAGWTLFRTKAPPDVTEDYAAAIRPFVFRGAVILYELLEESALTGDEEFREMLAQIGDELEAYQDAEELSALLHEPAAGQA